MITVHKKSKEQFLRELKSITKRSNGKGLSWLKNRLTEYIRGWIGYYYLADMKHFSKERRNGIIDAYGVISGNVGNESVLVSRTS